jgi:aspartokinase-like uncharacterized kinase
MHRCKIDTSFTCETKHRTLPLNRGKLKDALSELSEQQLIIITGHDEFSDVVREKFRVERDQELSSLICTI